MKTVKTVNTIITQNAPAKINLSLDITGRRGDGYHLLRSVMQSVDLADTVTVRPLDTDTIAVTCDNPEIPPGDQNICHRAARLFCSALCERGLRPLIPGVRIDIVKRIPQGAGLAGGSADAAAVLNALNRLHGHPFTPEDLAEVGAQIGADVPFCLTGGTALCEGIGERVTPLPPLPRCAIVLAKPRFAIATSGAFMRYDTLATPFHPDVDAQLAAIASGDLRAVAAFMGNALEDVAEQAEIPTIRVKMLAHGALGAMMTGSGSAVFGLFEDEQAAKQCRDLLAKEYPFTALTAPI